MGSEAFGLNMDPICEKTTYFRENIQSERIQPSSSDDAGERPRKTKLIFKVAGNWSDLVQFV